MPTIWVANDVCFEVEPLVVGHPLHFQQGRRNPVTETSSDAEPDQDPGTSEKSGHRRHTQKFDKR